MGSKRTASSVAVIEKWRGQLHVALNDDIILGLNEDQIAIIRRLWIMCADKHPMSAFAHRLVKARVRNLDSVGEIEFIDKLSSYLIPKRHAGLYWSGINDALKDTDVDNVRIHTMREIQISLMYAFVIENENGFREIANTNLSALFSTPDDEAERTIGLIYSYLDGNEGDLPFPWVYRMNGLSHE